MKIIYTVLIGCSFVFASCGKGVKDQKVDTTSIDTAGVEQLEKELKALEEQSSKVNQKIDSVDNLLNE
jgi:hypothetical protein